MFDVEPSALFRRDTGVCARPRWDSLGYFLKPLQTRAQFEAAIAVLNKSWLDRCLDAAQLRKALSEIKADKRKLPLEILQTAVYERTLSKRGFARDGVWYRCWHKRSDLTIMRIAYQLRLERSLLAIRSCLFP